MQTKLICYFPQIFVVAALATSEAGLVPASAKYLVGPSSKTTIVGPDGSVIDAFAPGGKILLEDNHGPVLQGAPVVIAKASVALPAPTVVVGEKSENFNNIEEQKSQEVSTEIDEVAVESADNIEQNEQTTVSEKESVEITTVNSRDGLEGQLDHLSPHGAFVILNSHFDENPYPGHDFDDDFAQHHNFGYYGHHF